MKKALILALLLTPGCATIPQWQVKECLVKGYTEAKVKKCFGPPTRTFNPIGPAKQLVYAYNTLLHKELLVVYLNDNKVTRYDYLTNEQIKKWI